ncbi:MAG: hypothetical protein J4G09_08265 [Proteobacteria bacterium]|nr:hypothetical protein [Pseudomonadota bacterium]
MLPRQPAFFVSADWGRDAGKRSVYVADAGARRVRREISPGWNLKRLMALARDLSARGSVLVGIDAALGVPAGYWERVCDECRPEAPASFVDWLRPIDPSSGFFDSEATVEDPDAWRTDRPWFAVQPRPGGLDSFKAKTRDRLLRRIDRETGAKPIFAVRGMPGTVGSGTRSFWRELVPILADDRDFAVWPFEGELSSLLAETGIVLAETYPGLAYAAALSNALPIHRVMVPKTKRPERERASDLLERASWVAAAGVDLGDLAPARDNEDDFDAHFTAAAVLRCVLERRALVDPDWVDATAEGSMLLAGPVDPARKAKKFAAWARRSSRTENADEKGTKEAFKNECRYWFRA